MAIRRRVFALLMLLLVPVAGCGEPQATAAPLVPTPSPLATAPAYSPLPPTDTPLTPTDTAAPPTNTALPPTAAPSPTATNTSLPPVVAALETLLTELAREDLFSGAVLVAREEEPIFSDAYGPADRALEAANRVDTRFNLGSMNKMFTAVAILQLAEQGRLSVNDRIVDHLPDYANEEVSRKVTIHHLLTNTSGLGDVFTDEYDRMPKDQLMAPEDWLPLFVDDPLAFEPGDRFAYSNAGYVVLGLIIESISGQSYYDYVREQIFVPSGMLDTESYGRDEVVSNLAVGYTRLDEEGNELEEPVPNSDQLPGRGFPAGGGYSTVGDLLSFRNALLSHQLLSPEGSELLMTGKVELREDLWYAYGFFDRTVAGQRVVGHSGGFPGICDFLDMYVELGYTVIVLSNTDRDCMAVLDLLQEQPLE